MLTERLKNDQAISLDDSDDEEILDAIAEMGTKRPARCARAVSPRIQKPQTKTKTKTTKAKKKIIKRKPKSAAARKAAVARALARCKT